MSTFLLKCIALIFMVIDHIGFYFDNTPTWLRLVGRISYPVFLYCMVWGYQYTHNRLKYLCRLYFMSVFMSVFIYSIDLLMPTEYGFGNHNIFVPLFLVGLLISAIELYSKDSFKGFLFIAGIFGVQLLYSIIPRLVPAASQLSGDILTGFIPNLALNEYGLEFIILGILMYYLKERKDLFCAMYLLFCIAQFSMDMLYGEVGQSMMILALPFMLLYNRKKGHSMKLFFYLFYPAHTFLLFYLSNFIIK